MISNTSISGDIKTHPQAEFSSLIKFILLKTASRAEVLGDSLQPSESQSAWTISSPTRKLSNGKQLTKLQYISPALCLKTDIGSRPLHLFNSCQAVYMSQGYLAHC